VVLTEVVQQKSVEISPFLDMSTNFTQWLVSRKMREAASTASIVPMIVGLNHQGLQKKKMPKCQKA